MSWLSDQEKRLRAHPFLSPARSTVSALSFRSDAGYSPSSGSSAPLTPRASPSTVSHDVARAVSPSGASFGYGYARADAAAATEAVASERARADEAVRLWHRAESALSRATHETQSLRQRVADLEAEKSRAARSLEEETSRRRAAEAAARSRAKEASAERRRADDTERSFARLDDERATALSLAADREREMGALHARADEAEVALEQRAHAERGERRAVEAVEFERDSTRAAERRAAGAERRCAELTASMESSADAEHDRVEAAKEAFAQRAARDRACPRAHSPKILPTGHFLERYSQRHFFAGERARLAELAHAEKAEELLQLWQKFKQHQPEEQQLLLDDGPALDAHDLLRAKIDEARRGLESSKGKLGGRPGFAPTAAYAPSSPID